MWHLSKASLPNILCHELSPFWLFVLHINLWIVFCYQHHLSGSFTYPSQQRGITFLNRTLSHTHLLMPWQKLAIASRLTLCVTSAFSARKFSSQHGCCVWALWTSRCLLVQLPAQHWFFFIFFSPFFSFFCSLHVPGGKSLETLEAQSPTGHWPSFLLSYLLAPGSPPATRWPVLFVSHQVLIAAFQSVAGKTTRTIRSRVANPRSVVSRPGWLHSCQIPKTLAVSLPVTPACYWPFALSSKNSQLCANSACSYSWFWQKKIAHLLYYRIVQICTRFWDLVQNLKSSPTECPLIAHLLFSNTSWFFLFCWHKLPLSNLENWECLWMVDRLQMDLLWGSSCKRNEWEHTSIDSEFLFVCLLT